jgi:acetyltransferase-like isoleucine patch superfamily enzyme
MKNIIIIGTGAVAAELTSYIEDNNLICSEKINLVGYLEYDYNIELYYKKYELTKPILGNIDDFVPEDGQEFLIGFANINFKKIIIDKLVSKKAIISNFIHHSAIVANTSKIGKGNIIYPHCIIGPKAIIGDYNNITSYSFISHDCILGNNNFLSTAGLAGRVEVGDNNFFGIRSTVIPSIKIGNNNTIQAGMVIDKNINDDSTVFYRFKEQITAIYK